MRRHHTHRHRQQPTRENHINNTNTRAQNRNTTTPTPRPAPAYLALRTKVGLEGGLRKGLLADGAPDEIPLSNTLSSALKSKNWEGNDNEGRKRFETWGLENGLRKKKRDTNLRCCKLQRGVCVANFRGGRQEQGGGHMLTNRRQSWREMRGRQKRITLLWRHSLATNNTTLTPPIIQTRQTPPTPAPRYRLHQYHI